MIDYNTIHLSDAEIAETVRDLQTIRGNLRAHRDMLRSEGTEMSKENIAAFRSVVERIAVINSILMKLGF